MDLTVSSSPHISTKQTTSGIMLDVIIALAPAGLAGMFYFGLPALSVILMSVAVCVLSEHVWQKIMKKPTSIGDFSAIVTGLLLAYSLPPTTPLYMVAAGAVFAIIIVKQLFGGLGHNFMNPALSGRAFMLAAWSGALTSWTFPSVLGMDAVSSSTPLSLLQEGNLGEMPGFLDMFLGNIGGCIGETCSVLILLGGLYLVVRRVISFRIPLTYIATVAVLTFILGGGNNVAESFNIMISHLLSGGLLLAAFFMATDYTTSPVTPVGQIVMGAGCGLITTVIRLYGGYPEGATYAIMLMNVATPLIEKYTRPRVFGHVKEKKQKKEAQQNV